MSKGRDRISLTARAVRTGQGSLRGPAARRNGPSGSGTTQGARQSAHERARRTGCHGPPHVRHGRGRLRPERGEFFQPIAARLTGLLDVAPGEDALDLGCGRGALTVRLAAAGARVTAVDLSPAMVAHTREAVAGHDVTVLEMDATRPTLPEASFDVLGSSLVLFFLPDPRAALSRWLRLLRPGGRFGFTTFGQADATFEALGDLFEPYIPKRAARPARTSAEGRPVRERRDADGPREGSRRLRRTRRGGGPARRARRRARLAPVDDVDRAADVLGSDGRRPAGRHHGPRRGARRVRAGRRRPGGRAHGGALHARAATARVTLADCPA